VLIDRTSLVTLNIIESSSEDIVTALDVSASQRNYVAPNTRSLMDAKANKGSWYRAIHANQMPIGFVLLFKPFLPGAAARSSIEMDQIGLWRFMIDHRFQRMGFGRRALDLVCKECKRHSGVRQILSSYVPGPDGPETFYLSYGFVKTGNLSAGGSEVEIALPLN
jgi:diamine N-acetyltransferase